eukprot:5524583-Prymnesium_polylepis.1
MDRIFGDGHATDGSIDSEMVHHPIVRAHNRRMQATGNLTENCTNITSLGNNRSKCTAAADEHRPTLGQYISVSFQTAMRLSEVDRAALVQAFASYFLVDSRSVQVNQRWQPAGAAIDVQ